MSRLQVVRHADPVAFLDRAEGWLLLREAENNLQLSLAYARRDSGVVEEDCLFATVEADGAVVGAVMRTPPHKVLLSEMPVEAAEPLASVLFDLYETIPAVLGPGPEAEAVAEAWVRGRGGRWRTGMRQRIYRLDSVVAPEGVPGTLRRAAEADLDRAVECAEGFAQELGQDFALSREAVERMIERGSMYFWEDEGRIGCMVVAQGATPRGCRIGFVYTPVGARGRGYASAATAAVSQNQLDAGREFCVLYTDLSNPISNRVYRNIGYQGVLDVQDVDVVARDEGPG